MYLEYKKSNEPRQKHCLLGKCSTVRVHRLGAIARKCVIRFGPYCQMSGLKPIFTSHPESSCLCTSTTQHVLFCIIAQFIMGLCSTLYIYVWDFYLQGVIVFLYLHAEPVLIYFSITGCRNSYPCMNHTAPAFTFNTGGVEVYSHFTNFYIQFLEYMIYINSFMFLFSLTCCTLCSID